MGLLDDFLSESKKEAPQAAIEQTKPSSGGADPFASIITKAAAARPATARLGDSPTNPIPDSPLSLMEQASLGWNRTPKDQLEALGKHFEEAQLVGSGDSAKLVVKSQGQWHETNPEFQWHFSVPAAAAGAAAGFVGGGPIGALTVGGLAGLSSTLMDSKNLKNLPSEIAFDTGRYGLRTAAGAAAAAGAVASLPASVPAAAVAGAGILASGAGSALAEGGEVIAKGSKNPEAIKAQMAAGMIYGMAQEAGGKAANMVLGNAAKSLGNVINVVAQNPEGRLAVRKLLSMIPGGADDMLVDARLKNPLRNAHFDEVASQDMLDPQQAGKIGKIQEGAVSSIEDSLKAQRNVQGREFGKLQADPKVTSSVIDASEAHATVVKDLQSQGYLTADGKINPNREYGEGDVSAINKILKQTQKIQSMSYNQARELAQDLGQVLNKGVNNNTIGRAVTQLKDGIHNSIVRDLPEEAGMKYSSILNQYSGAMDILNGMQRATDTAAKTSTFVKQIQSDNPSANKSLLNDLINAGVSRDFIDVVLQTEGSRKMAVMFTKPGLVKQLLPNGMKIQASVVTGASKLMSAFKSGSPATEAALPYADKAFEVLQKLPVEQRAQALRDPKSIDAIMQGIQQGVMGEQQTTEKLLQGIK